MTERIEGSIDAHNARQRRRRSDYWGSARLMGEAVSALERRPEDELPGPRLDPNAYLGDRRRWPRRER